MVPRSGPVTAGEFVGPNPLKLARHLHPIRNGDSLRDTSRLVAPNSSRYRINRYSPQKSLRRIYETKSQLSLLAIGSLDLAAGGRTLGFTKLDIVGTVVFIRWHCERWGLIFASEELR